MKLSCKHCGNVDPMKFAPRKKGVICLGCYESEVEYIPESALEKAQFEIALHLGRPTGGNNRKWTKAYREMCSRLAFLESMPGKTESQLKYIEGYRDAVNMFNEGSK